MPSERGASQRLTALRIFLVLTGVTVMAGCASQGTSAQDAPNAKPPLMVIESPRHPRTFYLTGDDKLSQDLRWDEKANQLCAYVAYSLVPGGGDVDMDPANYRVLELPFPDVHLDKDGNLFVLSDRNQTVPIGHLVNGVFGTEVALDDRVHLSAHRRDQVLSAKLIVDD